MNRSTRLTAIGSIGISQCCTAQVYTQTGNVPIPDIDTITWDFNINDSAVISDLDVGLMITHTWQGDITVSISHLDTGTTMTLMNRPGGTGTAVGYSADNYGNLNTGAYFVLDDEALGVYDSPMFGGVGPTSTGINNVTGRWRPDSLPNDGVGNLGVFDGENVQGTWRLRVDDFGSGDIGAIRALQLTIPVPSALAVFGLWSMGRRRSC